MITGNPTRIARRATVWERTWRLALSADALNGLSTALGMLLITVLVHTVLGSAATIHSTVGVIVALIPDRPRARRGKFLYLLSAPVLGIPLFAAVQWLRTDPVMLGAFLVVATFLAFLIMAWGMRGMPVATAIMLAMLLALAPQPASDGHEVLMRTLQCALGSGLYLIYATISNSVLNGRNRSLIMAELLQTVAALLTIYARRIGHLGTPDAGPMPPSTRTGTLMQKQAALSDQLQIARDLVLEAPRTPRRQQLAGMLMVVLEMRDRLITGELDLEQIRTGQTHALQEVCRALNDMADDINQVSDALLLTRTPHAARDHSAQLTQLRAKAFAAAQSNPDDSDQLTHAASIRALSARMGDLDAAVRQLVSLARKDSLPDLSAVRSGWQLFVSQPYWTLQPLLDLWHWRQPPLRHAIRATLAIGFGYTIAQVLPWASRDYWILLTIVVVLRGSLAQTLERRNARVIGTVIGSLLAAAILAFHPSELWLFAVVILSQGMIQTFVIRHYAVSAVAASVLGLVQGQLLYAGSNPYGFAVIERIGDTLLGAGIAWTFAYVLPTWERHQLKSVGHRVCRALARHAQHSLALASIDVISSKPELTWRLARREAYDALSALIMANNRTWAEPRAVRPPLDTLERLQGYGYQLLGQLSAIQSILLLRRDQLQSAQIAEPVEQAAQQIGSTLDLVHNLAPSVVREDTLEDSNYPALAAIPESLPDPFSPDSSPWLLRRLVIATRLAHQVRASALQLFDQLDQGESSLSGLTDEVPGNSCHPPRNSDSA